MKLIHENNSVVTDHPEMEIRYTPIRLLRAFHSVCPISTITKQRFFSPRRKRSKTSISVIRSCPTYPLSDLSAAAIQKKLHGL
ncbi:hypothetical protein Zmor_000086 [Zophobas morio]|uniref:Uncharacterized protein n=1 Tax=Zophobas morio TaxID=2755281 RepID=A0AA38J3M0_9CUCU|nr:hypothetical protein Zmor_000086 [Zophobas morio]